MIGRLHKSSTSIHHYPSDPSHQVKRAGYNGRSILRLPLDPPLIRSTPVKDDCAIPVLETVIFAETPARFSPEITSVMRHYTALLDAPLVSSSPRPGLRFPTSGGGGRVERI